MLRVGLIRLGLLTCKRAEADCSIHGPSVFAELSNGHTTEIRGWGRRGEGCCISVERARSWR